MKKLYYGDNLEVLRKYIKDESIDLCYIDPPFNSKRNYNQIYNNVGKEDKAQAQAFIDTWTWDDEAIKGFEQITTNYNGIFTKQSIELIIGLEKVLGKDSLLTYLISMTLRIAEIQRVLKPTGSFYLHCDPTASHYLKLVLDSIFCPKGGDFQNEIVWCYKERELSRKRFNKKHDIILFYTKSDKYTFNPDLLLEPYSAGTLKKFNYTDEEGRKFQIRGGGGKYTGKQGLNIALEESHPDLVYRDYLDKSAGILPRDWWEIPFINRAAKERLGYPTQKPEALLEKIVKASSNEGDTILDAYCGCGTTIAVAEKLNRNWIGIDITYQSISLILKRLEDSFTKSALAEVEINGVPRDISSAVALAHKKDDRTRKEFEKWAVLTYSNNRAIINEKKGADGGIDGIAYILDIDNANRNQEVKQVLFSVKSDKSPKLSYVRDFFGTIEREKAAMGYFITLYPPTRDMIAECKRIGNYKNALIDKEFPRIEIVTVNEILNDTRLSLPLSYDVVKSAQLKELDRGQSKLF